jgi:hypothetical protein
MRFLLERYGAAETRAYYRAMHVDAPVVEADFASTFQNVFGEELDTAWEAFLAEQRCPFDFWFCDSFSPVDLPFSIGEIDCEDPQTQGYELPESRPNRYGPVRLVSVHANVSTDVTVRYGSGVEVFVMRCGTCDQQQDAQTLTVGTGTAECPMTLLPGDTVFVLKTVAGGVPLFEIRPIVK